MKYSLGQSALREEDRRFLQGQGRYTDDINLPGQAYSYILRSPHAHARIRAIEAEAARRSPGVLAVFAGDVITPPPVAFQLYFTPGVVEPPVNIV